MVFISYIVLILLKYILFFCYFQFKEKQKVNGEMLFNQNIEKNRNLGLGIKVIKHYISGRYINDIIAFNPPFL